MLLVLPNHLYNNIRGSSLVRRISRCWKIPYISAIVSTPDGFVNMSYGGTATEVAFRRQRSG